MSARWPAAVTALALVATVGFAQSPALVKTYETNLKKFGEGQAKAKGVVLKAFDAEIKAAGNSPLLRPSARLARQEQLKEAKDRFATSGDWPGYNMGMMGAEWQYVAALNKLYVPLSVSIERLIDAHAKAGNPEAGRAVLAEKEKLEEQFPGRRLFTGGSKWAGTAFKPNGDTHPADLNVGDVTNGTLFRGTAVGHPRNAPPVVATVIGELEGLHVMFRNTAVVSGGKQSALMFDGALSGRRMLLAVGGVGANGKPAGGFVVLQRQGN